jgi:hypothetical protein
MIKYLYPTSEEELEPPFGTHEGAWRIINWYRVIKHFTWQKIAETPAFLGIPPGTLHDIWTTRKVPRKYREQLGIKSRPRIAIHKEDMWSAAWSIINNIEPNLVDDLITNLKEIIEKKNA